MKYDESSWQEPSFSLFLTLWNKTHGNETPDLHLSIATWLGELWMRGEKRALLQAFRASGKSSLVGLFSAWLLTRDPDLRILVLSAESGLATKMARNIRTIIEKHSLTRPLIPAKTREWASHKFTVNRQANWRDPSVWSAGIHSNITGARADIIICDDVEVPNTCDTADARTALRARLAETEFILNPGGMMLYIGTPHCYETIYADQPESGDQDVFLKDYARLSIPLVNEKGESAWPERFTDETIALQKKQVGPIRFAAQMMLTPVNIAQARLNAGLLNRYEAQIEAQEIQRRLYLSLGDEKLVSCSAWWDPAFGSAKGDDSVLAVIFDDAQGNRYLHHMEYIRLRGDEDEDEAHAQCRIIAGIARRFYIPSIAVETNGIGQFLPGILQNVLAGERVSCGVQPIHTSRAKDVRILESFDAVMAARALHVHESVYRTPFPAEMQEWHPGLKNARDDGLDAAAGALSLKPARLKRHYYTGRPGWMGGQQEARTDFDC